ncbi:hypothetical protein SAMN04488084_1251, partial [Pedobacter antarcticus]
MRAIRRRIAFSVFAQALTCKLTGQLITTKLIKKGIKSKTCGLRVFLSI